MVLEAIWSFKMPKLVTGEIYSIFHIIITKLLFFYKIVNCYTNQLHISEFLDVAALCPSQYQSMQLSQPWQSISWVSEMHFAQLFPHLNLLSLCVSCMRGAAISLKFGTKWAIYCTIPRKLLSFDVLLGGSAFTTASIFSGAGWIPLSGKMWPNDVA